MTDTSLTNPPAAQHGFSFFTNYAHVLLLIAQASDVRMRELAADVGITERAIQRIIEDLVNAGYLSVTKEGRRNRYELRDDLPLKRLPLANRTIGDLVRFVHNGPAQQNSSKVTEMELANSA